MTICLRRRDFIAALGGAAAWPLVARGQQPMPVIGFLTSGGPISAPPAFLRGLNELKQTTPEYRQESCLNAIHAVAEIYSDLRSQFGIRIKHQTEAERESLHYLSDIFKTIK